MIYKFSVITLISLLTFVNADVVKCLSERTDFKSFDFLNPIVPYKFLLCNKKEFKRELKGSNKRAFSRLIRQNKSKIDSKLENCSCVPTTPIEKFYVESQKEKIDKDKERIKEYSFNIYLNRFRETLRSFPEMDSYVRMGSIDNNTLLNIPKCSLSVIKQKLEDSLPELCGIKNPRELINTKLLGKNFENVYKNSISNIPQGNSCIGSQTYKRLSLRSEIASIVTEALADKESRKKLFDEKGFVKYSSQKILDGNASDNHKRVIARFNSSLLSRYIAKNKRYARKLAKKIKGYEYTQDNVNEVIEKATAEIMKDLMSKKTLSEITKSLNEDCGSLVEKEVVKAAFCPFKSNNPEFFKKVSPNIETINQIKSNQICNENKGLVSEKPATLQMTQAAAFLAPTRGFIQITSKDLDLQSDLIPDTKSMSWMCGDIKCNKNSKGVGCTGSLKDMEKNLLSRIEGYLVENEFIGDKCLNKSNGYTEKDCIKNNKAWNDIKLGKNSQESIELLSKFRVVEQAALLNHQTLDNGAEEMDFTQSIDILNELRSTSSSGWNIESERHVKIELSNEDISKPESKALSTFSVESGKDNGSSVIGDYFINSTKEDVDRVSSFNGNGIQSTDTSPIYTRKTQVAPSTTVTYNQTPSTSSVLSNESTGAQTDNNISRTPSSLSSVSNVDIEEPVTEKLSTSSINERQYQGTDTSNDNLVENQNTTPSSKSENSTKDNDRNWNLKSVVKDNPLPKEEKSISDSDQNKLDQLNESLRKLEEQADAIEKGNNDLRSSTASTSRGRSNRVNREASAVSDAGPISSGLSSSIDRSNNIADKLSKNLPVSDSLNPVANNDNVTDDREKKYSKKSLDSIREGLTEEQAKKLAQKGDFVPSGDETSSTKGSSSGNPGTIASSVSGGKNGASGKVVNSGAARGPASLKEDKIKTKKVNFDDFTFSKVILENEFTTGDLEDREPFLKYLDIWGKNIITLEILTGKKGEDIFIKREYTVKTSKELLELLGIKDITTEENRQKFINKLAMINAKKVKERTEKDRNILELVLKSYTLVDGSKIQLDRDMGNSYFESSLTAEDASEIYDKKLAEKATKNILRKEKNVKL